MKSALEPGLVESWAEGKLLVGLDFDGTLAPIVSDPAAAAMSASTRAVVAQVAQRYPVVVISGRSGADLAARFAGVEVSRLIGNHGAELVPVDPAALEQVELWKERLAPLVASLPGAVLEDKQASLSVHVRHTGDPEAALQHVHREAARLVPDARQVSGKAVLNLVLPDHPHKGHALVAALEAAGCERALYVGDDWTDEDVFTLDDPRVIGVRVGYEARSRACAFVTTRDEVDRLLERLAAAR